MIALLALLACTPEPDPCAEAWTEMAALRDGMVARYGSTVTAPDEATFKAACEALPPEQRVCFSPTKASGRPECKGLALDALPPAP